MPNVLFPACVVAPEPQSESVGSRAEGGGAKAETGVGNAAGLLEHL